MIFTSRFANPELKSGKYTAVRISLGAPRWKLGYEIAGTIDELMPRGIFGIEDYDEFYRRYFEKLDAVGVEKIREKLQQFEKLGKPVILLCFEDIRKGKDNWCHRNIFASWWMKNTGEIIPELKDDSKFKIDAPKKTSKTTEQDKAELSQDDSADMRIQFVLFEEPASKAYQMAKDGTEQEIDFESALKLVRDKKATIQNILTK